MGYYVPDISSISKSGEDVGDILGCPKKDNIRAGSFGK
jgi:hypothetical protein